MLAKENKSKLQSSDVYRQDVYVKVHLPYQPESQSGAAKESKHPIIDKKPTKS